MVKIVDENKKLLVDLITCKLINEGFVEKSVFVPSSAEVQLACKEGAKKICKLFKEKGFNVSYYNSVTVVYPIVTIDVSKDFK